MERQNRLLTALATVLLVLVAIAVFGKQPDTDPAADPDAPAERKLFTFEADKATSLTLTGPSGTISFEKVDGAWKMTAPKPLVVEERRVTEILDRFATLKVQEKGFDGNLADFGLDEGARVAVDIGAEEGRHLTLFVGRDAPVGYRSYVAEKAEGPALLASSRIGDLVKRSADDFRSKDVWRVASATAHRVRIEQGGTAVVLRKDDHGWWLGDSGPRASDDAVQEWLSNAGMLRVESFKDDADPASLGLTPPAATLTVDDSSGTKVLELGNHDETGVDAKSEAGQVRLGKDALDLVKLDGWADDKLMPVRRMTVDTVEVQLGDKKLHLVKGDDGWKDASGAASTAGTALIDAIDNAKADRSAQNVVLGNTWGHVTLSEGTDRTETITIGDAAADGSRAAKDEAGGPPFRVSAETLAAIVAAVP